MDLLIRLLRDGQIFKYYKYKDGLGLPNHLVVTVDQHRLVFIIRQASPMHESHPRILSVSIALEIPKKKKLRVAFPHDLKRYWLAFKLYEESLQTYQGPQPPMIGDPLIEPHQLLRLVSVETDFFKELLFDDVPQPQTPLPQAAEPPTHASLSEPSGMPDRVQIYRVMASNNMEVLQIIYFMIDIIRHRLFDTPIAPNEVQRKIEKYAAHTGGSVDTYLKFDQDALLHNNNIGVIDSQLGEDSVSPDQAPANNPMMLMNRSSLQPQDLPNLYRTTEEDSYVGQFNDPKKAYMALDHLIIGAPSQLYFERKPNIFDEDEDSASHPPESPKTPLEEQKQSDAQRFPIKQENKAQSEAGLKRPVPNFPYRSGGYPIRSESGFFQPSSAFAVMPPPGHSPLLGMNSAHMDMYMMNGPKFGSAQQVGMPQQSALPSPTPFYNYIPEDVICDKLDLKEGVQRTALEVLQKDLKFQYYREENENTSEGKLQSVKIRFAVKLLERNINFVICGDPDAIRVYTSLENLDLRYPLQVRREAVHKLVLELNQHITIGSFQLEERPLSLPNIELVMTIHYCVLPPNSKKLRDLLKRLISLSMATMKDIGIKLLEQMTRRPHNSNEAIEQSITQIINERRASRQIPNAPEQGLQMTPQQEQHELLAKFLQRFGNYVNMEELRIDADPKSKVKVITNDQMGEERNAPLHIAGGFSTIELVRFQGRPAIMKTMKNTRNLVMLLTEYRIMRKMSFEGVPSIYGLFYNHLSENVCLVMENVQVVNPFDKRYSVWPCTLDKFLPPSEVIPFAKVFAFLHEMLFVLQNIHRSDIAHCDLSPGNILIRSEPDSLKVFIIDFGSAIDVEELRSELSNPRMVMPQVARKLTFKSKGTLGFASPEVQLEQFPKTEPDNAKKVDIYSLGLLVYYLLFRTKLSDHVMEMQQSLYSEPGVMSVVKNDFEQLKERFPESEFHIDKLHEFIRQTLKQSAQQRPSAFQLWVWLKENERTLPNPEPASFAT